MSGAVTFRKAPFGDWDALVGGEFFARVERVDSGQRFEGWWRAESWAKPVTATVYAKTRKAAALGVLAALETASC